MMSKTSWALTIETERLILRPQESNDYQSWYTGFLGRLPQQYKYDEGRIGLDDCDPDWFTDLCKRHQEQALSDYAYIFGVFSKKTHQSVGLQKECVRRGFYYENGEWVDHLIYVVPSDLGLDERSPAIAA